MTTFDDTQFTYTWAFMMDFATKTSDCVFVSVWLDGYFKSPTRSEANFGAVRKCHGILIGIPFGKKMGNSFKRYWREVNLTDL